MSFILFQNFVLHEPIKLNHLIGLAMVLVGVCVVVAGPWHTVVLGRAPEASPDAPVAMVQMLDVPGNHSLDGEDIEDRDGSTGNDLRRLLVSTGGSPALVGAGSVDVERSVGKEASGAGDAATAVAT